MSSGYARDSTQIPCAFTEKPSKLNCTSSSTGEDIPNKVSLSEYRFAFEHGKPT